MSLLAALWLRGGTDASLFAALESMAIDLRYWFAEQEESDLPVPRLPDSLMAPAMPPGTVDSPRLSQNRRGTISADHTIEDSQACSRPHTQSRSTTEAHLIYKWIDDDGQTHMSDYRPEGRIASVMDMGMAKRDFTYEIIPDGLSIPVDFPGQLAAGSKRIYDTWHFFLGEEKLRQSRIELLLIGGPDRFNAYHAEVSPGSKPVNGFYTMSKNQAVVKFDPANQKQTLAITFHETSHLITASHLGPTPPWLTEGLAEYFETMQVKGQTGAIHPNPAHIKLLKKKPLPRLQEYLSIDRPDWYGANRDRNYALACTS
jgi:hypothetical protein